MKVICLKGKGKIGKSTMIKKILNDFFKIIIIPKKRKDISLSFPYNNKKIGLCSYGDNLYYVKKFLMPLKKEDCDIIICAIRTKGKALDFIKEKFGEEDITFINCIGDHKDNEKISQFKEKFKEYLKK